jgi:threonine/homoserine/homoserine lactone efflux protein
VLGLALSVMVGPVFFVLLETAAIRGFRAALVLDLGVIVADILFIAIAYFSSYQLLTELRNAPGLYVFGGSILVCYGLILLFKSDSRVNEGRLKTSQNDYLGLFAKGFLLNFINVGVLVFWLGIVLVVGPSLNAMTNEIVYYFSSVIATYLLVDVLKILLAKQLRNRLTPGRILWIKRVMGVLLILSGIVLIYRGFGPNGFMPEGELYKLK